jgi:glycosyltransferase involved in cell wall biosynthesis
MLTDVKRQLRECLYPSHKTPYLRSYLGFLRGRLRGEIPPPKYDLVFVIFDSARGWILEAMCREIAAYFPGKYCYHYSPKGLPPARAYYFGHYYFLPHCLKENPHVWGAKRLVLYTHPRDLGIPEREFIFTLNQATRVISMCSLFERLLVQKGVRPHKVATIVGAADPDMFPGHTRGGGVAGFCSAYKPLKSPDLILEIVRRMPHRRFMLLGRRWSEYERFSELLQLPNFTYAEAPYSDYPTHYASMDVFVSPAVLEGGPIPLIEAMMSNAVPVASRTGFAPDIIADGENGYTFEVGSPIDSICGLIDRAFELKVDVRRSVEHLSWQNFSLQVQKLLT